MDRTMKQCPLCGEREGERRCLKVGEGFICSPCCEGSRDENCADCPYIAADEHLHPSHRDEAAVGSPQAGYISAYLEEHRDIKAAVQELEGKHRQVYDEIAQDEGLMNDLAFQLFAREEFSDLYFDFQAIERCFQEMGYPPTLTLERADMASYVRDAVLTTATPELRARLATSLMRMIPLYVQKEEYREAWLLLLTSYLTAEMVDEPNPFLAQMFMGGLMRWLEWKDQQLEEKLQQLGVFPDQAPTPFTPQFGEWLAERMGEDKTWAEIDRLLTEHPEFEFLLRTRTDEMVVRSSTLLEREDFQPLLFSPGELVEEMEELVNSLDKMFTDSQKGRLSEQELWQEADSIYTVVARRGLDRVFDQERRKKLIAQLSDYAERCRGRGDSEAMGVAQAAQAALFSLNVYENDWENPFLLGLMMASLHRGVQQLIDRGEQEQS